MGFDFQKFSHLGFIKPVPKKERRSQVSSDFHAFASAYEKFGKQFRNVRGHELVSVMEMLRSMPPTHCWKGETVIKRMKKWGMGVGKVKTILSFLNQSGWIRYHKVVNGKRYVSNVMEVMFLQLAQEEAGLDRLIRLDEKGWPSIFRRVGEEWIAVPDSEYPPDYTADPLPDRDKSDAEPQVWLPSEWKSSERGAAEQQASPVYREDDIGQNSVQVHPIGPLSAKGDIPVAPGVSDNAEESLTGESGSALDSTSATPSRSPDLNRLVSQLVELGLRTVSVPESRTSYEAFVMEQMLPLLDPSSGRFLSKWHSQRGPEWLRTSPAGLVFLSLFNDSCWPEDMGRSFHRKAKYLTLDDWRKLLLGFDWSRREKSNLASLRKKHRGKVTLKNWDRFWEQVEQGYRRRRQDAATYLENLSHPGGERDFAAAEYWVGQTTKIGETIPPVGKNHSDRLRWLYYVGLFKQAAFNEASPDRGVFLRNRDAWKDSLAAYVASDRLSLAVVVFLKDSASMIWGLNMDDLKARHDRFMETMHLSARCYKLEVKDSFAHLFDEDPWAHDSCGNEEPLIEIPGNRDSEPAGRADSGAVAETNRMDFSANSIVADFSAILNGGHNGVKMP